MRLAGWKSPTELTTTDSVLEDAENRGRINPGKYNAQGFGRTPTCPQCGRTWVMRCRPDQWGYWYQDTGAKKCRLVLFCGPACAKAWTEEKERREAEELTKTVSYEAWRLVRREHLQESEASARLGVPKYTVHNAVMFVEDHRYRAVEWLDKHKEEVGA